MYFASFLDRVHAAAMDMDAKSAEPPGTSPLQEQLGIAVAQLGPRWNRADADPANLLRSYANALTILNSYDGDNGVYMANPNLTREQYNRWIHYTDPRAMTAEDEKVLTAFRDNNFFHAAAFVHHCWLLIYTTKVREGVAGEPCNHPAVPRWLQRSINRKLTVMKRTLAILKKDPSAFYAKLPELSDSLSQCAGFSGLPPISWGRVPAEIVQRVQTDLIDDDQLFLKKLGINDAQRQIDQVYPVAALDCRPRLPSVIVAPRGTPIDRLYPVSASRFALDNRFKPAPVDAKDPFQGKYWPPTDRMDDDST